MSEILARMAQAFDPTAIGDAIIRWLPSAVVALAILLVFWLLDRAARRGLAFLMSRAEFDQTAVTFLQNLVRYALFTIAVVTALGQVGVDVTSLLASLGVVGLTIGFAARDALSNVISGMFIFWDRPFVIGDLVEIGSDYGKVHDITMRSTRIVTPDGRMLAIPNSTIVNNTVASYTNFPHLRLDMDVTINVNEDIDKSRAVLLGLVDGDPAFMDMPAPVVGVTALNDYNTALQLRVWLKDEKSHVQARMELRERMFKALTAAGVDMPFETLRLEPLEVRRTGT